MADNSNTEQTSRISEPTRKGSDAPDSDNRPPTNPPRSTSTVECNMMEYTDDQGVTHQIYLPKGTMQRAGRLFLEKNWEELGKFPAYEGQGYSDEDLVQTEEEVGQHVV
ncbi:hypothetical protein V8F33_009495 [Rhypophila sp. PSN 637]